MSFCGTGCGVLVGIKDNRLIASQGDPDAEVNRGLNCIKGYFLPKIMYGKDRLTQPMLRMKMVNMTKTENLLLSVGTWHSALWLKNLSPQLKLGPNGIGMFTSGQSKEFLKDMLKQNCGKQDFYPTILIQMLVIVWHLLRLHSYVLLVLMNQWDAITI